MTTEIINALNAKFNADKLTAFANLTNYMNNSAAVGDGKLQTLSELLPKKVEETK